MPVVRRVVLPSAALARLALSAAAPLRTVQPRCGVDRWSVKVMADPDAARIDTTIIESSIAALGALPIPEVVYPANGRIPPHEFRVYQVRAVVEQIMTESDGDWHLVLRDPDATGATLIAEIPSPLCAANTSDGARYVAVRDSLRRVPRRGVVVVEGVAFWDFIHNQRGRARNGIELHPVLRLVRDREGVDSRLRD